MRLSADFRFGIAVLAVSVLAPIASTRGQEAATSKTQNATSATAGGPSIQKKVETYLRNLYAFGSETGVKVAAPKDMGVEGLLEVDVEIKIGENSQAGKVYITKDGKYMFRGEVSDLSKDPAAEARAKLQINDAPSTGDPKAPITLVEFSDFECPVCRSLHDTLRGLLPNYPQVRVVFKNFPLEQIHPWARTAALAGQCAYQQQPKAFWKLYDLIYDNQELISAENAWTKMLDYASQAEVNPEAFKACMASPEAAAAVNASHENGMQLEVGSTPTVFVNGRRLVGADPRLIEQFIKYELEQRKAAAKN